MANRRMFSKNITSASRFLMMSLSAQALYFQLGMNADDDGYVEHFTVIRMVGGNPDDLKMLAAKGFVEVFDDHVLIILDWEKHNKIQPSRKIPSQYIKVYVPSTKCRQITDKTPEQVRLGKVRKEKTPPADVCEDIIQYLNDTAGRKFDITNEDHHRYIRLRWKKHPDIEKFKFVIDVCCIKWKDNPDMCDYLQPSTLFNGKFAERLGWKKPNTDVQLTAIQKRELLRSVE